MCTAEQNTSARPSLLLTAQLLAEKGRAGTCRYLHQLLAPGWARTIFAGPVEKPFIQVPLLAVTLGLGYLVPAFLAFTNPNPMHPWTGVACFFLCHTGSSINVAADFYKLAAKAAGIKVVKSHIYNGELAR